MRTDKKTKASKPGSKRDSLINTPRADTQKPVAGARSVTNRAEVTTVEAISAMPQVTEQERHHLIAEAAYYRAEQRRFAPGYELEDWLNAEAEIARLLQRMV